MNRPYVFSEELKEYLIKQYTEFNISANKLAVETQISVPTIINMLRKNGVLVSNKAEDKQKKYAKDTNLVVTPIVGNKYYVYFHKTVKDNAIFYVGKGAGKRAESKSNRGKDWYSFVENNDYYIEYFAKDLDETTALRIEREQIALLPNLVNKNISNKIELSLEDCSNYFKYNEDAESKLERLQGVWTGNFSKGKIGHCGYIYNDERSNAKFWRIKFKNKSVLIHRIIWVLFNGTIPDNMVIDHIDGNSMNNSIDNLRCITKQLNTLNKSTSRANTTGVTGVFYFKEDNLEGYRAIVAYNLKKSSKRFYLHKHGETEAFRLACEWRKEQLRLLNEQGAGYTDRHGT